jgi:hypothetical protein
MGPVSELHRAYELRMNAKLRVPASKLERFGKIVNKSESLTPNQEPKVAPN